MKLQKNYGIQNLTEDSSNISPKDLVLSYLIDYMGLIPLSLSDPLQDLSDMNFASSNATLSYMEDNVVKIENELATAKHQIQTLPAYIAFKHDVSIYFAAMTNGYNACLC